MVTPKRRGTNFEYRVAYLFQAKGYQWERSGSSRGVDLKIYWGGRLEYLVACKKTSSMRPLYISKSEVSFLRSKAKEMRAKPMICLGFRRTPILALPLEKLLGLPYTRLFYKILPEDCVPLKKLLEKRTRKMKKREEM